MEYTDKELKNEIWKDIEDYEGSYQISNLGRVKSLFKGKEYIRKPSTTFNYLVDNTIKYYPSTSMTLVKNGKYTTIRVKELTGLYFVPNPNKYKHIICLDGDNGNLRASNLKWVTLNKVKTSETSDNIQKETINYLGYTVTIFSNGDVYHNNKLSPIYPKPNPTMGECVILRSTYHQIIVSKVLLLLLAFKPKLKPLKYIRYIDGNSNNINVNNLTWVNNVVHKPRMIKL